MRRLIILILTLIIITDSVLGNNQILSQLIKNQSDSLINKLKDKMAYEKLFDVNKKVDIKAYPFFSIKIGLSKKEISNDDLYLETKPNFFIIKYDSICYYVENCYFALKGLRLKRQLQSSSPYKSAINLAENKSNSVFLLYSKGMPVVGYIDKNDIKFIDTDLKSFNSLQSFIEYRFGNIESFIDEIERIDFEKQYLDKVRTFEEAKVIYKNYGFNYLKYNIYDTLSLSNAVIFGIEEFTKITEYQKKELIKELIRIIKESEFGKKDFDKLSLIELISYTDAFNNRIKYILQDVLTYKQFYNYLANEQLFLKLANKSENLILNYYKNEQKINNDSLIRQTIIKEIFKQ